MSLDKFRTGSAPLTGSVLHQITTPTTLWFVAELMDAVNSMCDASNWTQDGSVTIEQATQAAILMARSFDTMIGMIIPYVTTNAPDNCLACDGAQYDRADYPDLYAALDTAFIVDADHFVTPDLRGRTPVGAGSGYAIGDSGGEKEHTLTTAELPAHNHADIGHQHTTGNSFTFLALTGEEPVLMPNPIPALTGSASANIQNTGNGDAHNNMPPYLCLKYAVVAL